MAYNPFNVFRRNQKAIFAVLTVFIMFMFTLSSGLGGGADFFDWLPNWIRGKTQKGDVLCTVDGSKVYASEVDRVRRSRMYANQFMAMASSQAADNLIQYAQGQMGSISPDKRQLFEFAFRDPRFAMQLENLLGANAKPDELTAARSLRAGLMMAQLRAISPDHYFVNSPNRTNRDVVEFMLWEKKADQLGIKFTEADVKTLIQREFYGQFRDDRPIREAFKNRQGGFSIDAALRAIATEFKVRAAQTALLGPVGDNRTQTAPPVFGTPYDQFEFYREQCSPTTYEVLALPVESFLPAIPTPADTDPKFNQELQELFSKYQAQEPNPASEAPGFMEPRRVKVEWLKATGSEKYYQDAARVRMQAATAALQLLPPGLGGFEPLVGAATAQTDPIVARVYESEWAGKHRFGLELLADTRRTQFLHMRDFLDTSLTRPTNALAALLGVGGGVAGFAPPAAAVLPAHGAAIAFETRDRVRSGMAAFLGAVPGPGMFGTLVAGEVASRGVLPKPVPLAAVRSEVLKTAVEQEARKVMVEDMKKLKADVEKTLKDAKPDARSRDEARNKAKAAIDEFVKTRGLQKGESTGLRSEWTIEDDPGLAPLKPVWAKAQSAHGILGGERNVPFGRVFFWERQDRFNPNPVRRAATGLYRPEFYPDAAPNPAAGPFGEPDPVFLTWRTEEKQPRPVAFQEARAEVKAAWVRAKAREVARMRADVIANTLRTGTATSLWEIEKELNDQRYAVVALNPDPKAQEKVKRFALRDVAPLTPSDDRQAMLMGQGGGLQRFHLTPSANIPYPTREMEKELLDNRTKGVRTVLVLPDQPKDTYYVAAWADRQVKGEEEFARSVYGELAPPGVRDAVRSQFRQDSFKKAHDSVLGLLKKEFKYEESEEQKKKLDKSDRDSD